MRPAPVTIRVWGIVYLIQGFAEPPADKRKMLHTFFYNAGFGASLNDLMTMTRKYLWLVLGLAILLFAACQKAPELTITSSPNIELSADGSGGSITFTANRDWTVSSSDSWVSISPSSGAASDGPVTVSVRCNANTTYDDRTATVTIRMGELSQTITVRQSANLGVVLPSQTFDLQADARSLEVEVQANVEYSVEISENWVKQTGTKGLTSKRLSFSVEENKTYDPREAKITIKPKQAGIAEKVITIRQAQFDALIVEKTSYNMPYGGGEIEIKVEANVAFNVTPDSGWLHHVSTKALSSSTVLIKVDENTAHDAREGKIEIAQQGGSIKHIITIRQAQAPGLYISKKTFDLTNAAQSIEIEVQKNVNYSVIIDEACKGWITKINTKALSSDVIKFNIAANTNYDDREGKITFKQVDGSISETVVVHQGQAYGLFITKPEYDLTNETHTLTVEIKANVEYEVHSKAEWISVISTKSLSTTNITLGIQANSSYDDRTGTVVVKQTNGDLTGTISITQRQTDGLFVSPNAIDINSDEQTAELEIKDNVSFDVIIPDEAKSWLSIKSNTQTKSLTNDKVVLAFTKNESYDNRETTITIKQTDGPLAETVRIKQRQNNGLFVSPSEFEVSCDSQTISVEVSANVEFEITPDVDWIKHVSTKGLSASTISLSIAENTSFSSRVGKVSVKQKNGDLTGVITVTQKQMTQLFAKVESIGTTFVTLSGEMVLGREYDEKPSYFILCSSSAKTQQELLSTNAIYGFDVAEDGSYSVRVRWLEPETEYHFMVGAHFQNYVGWFYSEISSFTTKPFSYVAGEIVDLGLSVKWSSTNLGAMSPEDSGAYFAWGETETKKVFSWKTYAWCNGSETTLTKYNSKEFYGVVDNKNSLEFVDDAANVKLGNNWRIPTQSEWRELEKNCYWKAEEQNGVSGYLITSEINGNSIFLPKSALRRDDFYDNQTACGGYWTSDRNTGDPYEAYCLYAGPSGTYSSRLLKNRCYGLTLRPVLAEVTSISLDKTELWLIEGKSVTLTASVSPLNVPNKNLNWSSSNKSVVTVDQNGVISAVNGGSATITAAAGGVTATCSVTVYSVPDGAVDLGVVVTKDDGSTYPLFWAECNLGASKPEEYGEFYFWGETETQKGIGLEYGWGTYKWAAGNGTVNKYCPDNKPDNWAGEGRPDNKTVLDFEDDVARVKLGGKWRMPTREEQRALLDQCVWKMSERNGIKGYEVKSKSDSNAIFLPAAGIVYSFYNGPGSDGAYWSSSLSSYNGCEAVFTYFEYDSPVMLGLYSVLRSTGCSIRPVTE